MSNTIIHSKHHATYRRTPRCRCRRCHPSSPHVHQARTCVYRYSICSQKARPRKTVCCTGSAPAQAAWHSAYGMPARVRLSYPRVSAVGFGAAQRPSCGLGRRRRSRRCLSRCDVMAHPRRDPIWLLCAAEHTPKAHSAVCCGASRRGLLRCTHTRSHILLSMSSRAKAHSLVHTRMPCQPQLAKVSLTARRWRAHAYRAAPSSAWAEPACANADWMHGPASALCGATRAVP